MSLAKIYTADLVEMVRWDDLPRHAGEELIAVGVVKKKTQDGNLVGQTKTVP
jgi:hypothetical protein